MFGNDISHHFGDVDFRSNKLMLWMSLIDILRSQRLTTRLLNNVNAFKSSFDKFFSECIIELDGD